MNTKIAIKPLVEYRITFKTGETKHFNSIDEAIELIQAMINNSKTRIEFNKTSSKKLKEQIIVLAEELNDLKSFKLNNKL